MLELNQIYHGDCLELMPLIDDKSIDMILCDLPYGILKRKNEHTEWDVVIDPIKLWEQYNRIIKDNGAIVLTATQPFATDLINANRKYFRMELIWYKNVCSGFLQARKMPNKIHENILIFYKELPVYNPIKYYVPKSFIDKRKNKIRQSSKKMKAFTMVGKAQENWLYEDDGSRFPESVLCFNRDTIVDGSGHPTQKPVALFDYLIRMYSNEGDLVIDNCSGSGTTAIAAIDTKRDWICMEMNPEYYEQSKIRIENHLKQPKLF